MKQIEVWMAVSDDVDPEELEERVSAALEQACCGDYENDYQHRSPTWFIKVSEMKGPAERD